MHFLFKILLISIPQMYFEMVFQKMAVTLGAIELTHCGLGMPIVSESLVIIGSVFGLSPIQCQAIIWYNVDFFLSVARVWTKFSEICIKLSHSRKCTCKYHLQIFYHFVMSQWVKCFSVPAFDMKLVHVFLPTEIEQTLLKELFVNIWFWLIVRPVFHPLFGLVMHYDMCVS